MEELLNEIVPAADLEVIIGHNIAINVYSPHIGP